MFFPAVFFKFWGVFASVPFRFFSCSLFSSCGCSGASLASRLLWLGCLGASGLVRRVVPWARWSLWGVFLWSCGRFLLVSACVSRLLAAFSAGALFLQGFDF